MNFKTSRQSVNMMTCFVIFPGLKRDLEWLQTLTLQDEWQCPCDCLVTWLCYCFNAETKGRAAAGDDGAVEEERQLAACY